MFVCVCVCVCVCEMSLSYKESDIFLDSGCQVACVTFCVTSVIHAYHAYL